MNTPAEIAANYIGIAKSKTQQKWWKTFLLAVLAGAFIALGGVVSTVAASGFSGIQASLIKGAVFPLGLILVVICGAELFTGNCLLIAPALQKEIKIGKMLKNLLIVYCGNLVGGVLIAMLTVYSHAFGTATAEVCVSAAEIKSTMSFSDCLLRGILCNILVCLAVWGAMASKNAAGKILFVYLPVFAFVVCGFEHSVANMYYLTAGLTTASEYAITASGLTLGNALLFNLLPSTIGNIVGGGMVAVSYWAVYFHKEKS